MIQITTEKMSDEFTKHHIEGLPFNAVFHQFTEKDKGSPHCHPFSFVSHVIKGGYIEKVYHINDNGTWSTELIHRKPGTVHTVEATHIHELVELPEGECWTLIIPERHVRTPGFWDFNDKGISFRKWFEPDFKPFNSSLK